VKLIVIGVDGGGSHTRVVVADETGARLSSAEGAGSAVVPGAVERSGNVIANVVAEALQVAETGVGQPRALCVGVAGVGRPGEREALRIILTELALADEVVVLTDAETALEDAFGDGPGVLLTAGTGSIAYGRGPTGAASRCGGWGPVCGDEGSGAWIGRRALSVVTAASDGREPETALTSAVLAAIQCDVSEDLISWAASATPAALATLAPVVMQVAVEGDLRANALLTIAVEELGIHVRTLARQLFVDERAAVPVALGGGLLVKGSLMRKRLEQRLRTMVPGAQVRADEIVPVRGAVHRALRAAGVRIERAPAPAQRTDVAPVA
jgi:glucosamine kinase